MIDRIRSLLEDDSQRHSEQTATEFEVHIKIDAADVQQASSVIERLEDGLLRVGGVREAYGRGQLSRRNRGSQGLYSHTVVIVFQEPQSEEDVIKTVNNHPPGDPMSESGTEAVYVDGVHAVS